MPNVSLCEYFFTIGDVPFVHLLTRACNPVSFFLILGGYGMYIVYRKGDQNRYTRILKLYIHYWVILAIFLLVGFISWGRTPGSFLTILSNATGFQATYNGEIWFLLPYALLSVMLIDCKSYRDELKASLKLGIMIFFLTSCSSFIFIFVLLNLYLILRQATFTKV